MKRVCSILVAIILGLAAAGCDSNPDKPSRTVTTLAVVPTTDMLKLKATEAYTASATYSTGATEQVNASWTSDNQAVVTVTSTGTATAVGPGQATLTATYEGKSATRPIRVVPDYNGRWAGLWAVRECTTSGGLPATWCNGVNGKSFPAALELTQTRDVLSGTWTLQEATSTIQGTIGGDGALNLTGSSLQSGVTVTITSWRSISTDNSTMTGTFTLAWAVGGAGQAQTTVDLQNFTKQ